jgi:alanine racemase
MCIKDVPAGMPIGYACSFVTKQPTKVGIVSLGYFDGYDRRLSNNSVMLVGNNLMPVIGRIGMNMTALDLTGIPNVQLHDEVTILGNHDGIRVQDLAKRIDSIDYDVFNKLNAGLTRIIV